MNRHRKAQHRARRRGLGSRERDRAGKPGLLGDLDDSKIVDPRLAQVAITGFAPPEAPKAKIADVNHATRRKESDGLNDEINPR